VQHLEANYELQPVLGKVINLVVDLNNFMNSLHNPVRLV